MDQFKFIPHPIFWLMVHSRYLDKHWNVTIASIWDSNPDSSYFLGGRLGLHLFPAFVLQRFHQWTNLYFLSINFSVRGNLVIIHPGPLKFNVSRSDLSFHVQSSSTKYITYKMKAFHKTFANRIKYLLYRTKQLFPPTLPNRFCLGWRLKATAKWQ